MKALYWIISRQAMHDIYKYLHLDKLDCCVAIIKNAKSNKMGKKDIMKIECPITSLTWTSLDSLTTTSPSTLSGFPNC